MKKVILLLTILLSTTFLRSQTIIEWEQDYGESSNAFFESMIPTNDGGFLLGGYSETNDELYNYWVVKIDELGNIEWEQDYGGSKNDFLFSMISTNDGGFLLGGRASSGDGDIGDNNGESDCWIVKIDELGNIEWEQNYGGTGDEVLVSMLPINDGGFLLGGHSKSDDGNVGNNNGNFDYWIIKIDEVGSIEWEQNYGGTGEENLVSVISTNNGDFLLGGFSYSNNGDVGGSNGASDYWIVKIDGVGNIKWEQNYGSMDSELLRSFIQTNDDGFLMGGYKFINEGIDGWVVKIKESEVVSEIPTLYGAEQNQTLKITPNPNTGKFTIDNQNKTIKTIKIYDVIGALLQEQKANSPQINIEINAISGIYFLSIETEEGTFVEKIIIQ